MKKPYRITQKQLASLYLATLSRLNYLIKHKEDLKTFDFFIPRYDDTITTFLWNNSKYLRDRYASPSSFYATMRRALKQTANVKLDRSQVPYVLDKHAEFFGSRTRLFLRNRYDSEQKELNLTEESKPESKEKSKSQYAPIKEGKHLMFEGRIFIVNKVINGHVLFLKETDPKRCKMCGKSRTVVLNQESSTFDSLVLPIDTLEEREEKISHE